MGLTTLARRAGLTGALALGLFASGCANPQPTPGLQGQVQLTLIQTADVHSRLYPYNLQLGEVDAGLGLGATGQIVNVGGAARVSHVVGRERARADRVLHLDGGDSFQGAPVFNFYNGEAEIRALSAMGTDASLVANHEFDHGALNLGIQLQKWANFPVLAANYIFQNPSVPGASPLADIVKPFTVFDVKGLKVGVIGMGNLSSLTSIFDFPNRLGITPLNTTETAQFYVDLLRPQVDVVVILSHLGLDVDEQMITTTSGIDIVLGGHNHIVLQPPKRVPDCSAYTEPDPALVACDLTAANTCTGGEQCLPDPNNPNSGLCARSFIIYDRAGSGQGDVGCHQDSDCGDNGFCHGNAAALAMGTGECKGKRYCQQRDVLLAHSGAFAKFVGRLDLQFSNDPTQLPATYDPIDGFELISHEYTLFPINEATPEDPVVSMVLEPYQQGLDALGNLELLVGYALDGSKRNATGGGDSPLGNLISTAMWLRLGIQTDFALTNTTGIRTDLVPGPVTVEQMYNIFPFDNSITKMQLSGYEVQELFDFVASRSTGRGCVSQAQIAGARVVLDCTKGCDSSTCPAGQTCDPVLGSCVPQGLCNPSIVCPNTGSNPQTCDPNSGMCTTLYPGLATHVFIGPYLDSHNNPLECTSDMDCPDQLPNQCDPVGGVSFGSGPSGTPGCGFTQMKTKGVCYQPIQPFASYDLATSDYLASGGSGFVVLKRNTTQNNTYVVQRDALIDFIRAGAPCGADCNGNLLACSTDTECSNVLGMDFVCACPEASNDDGMQCTTAANGCGGKGARSCTTDDDCGGKVFHACVDTVSGNPCAGGSCVCKGGCVLAQCRDDVASFQRATCLAAPNASIQAQCEKDISPCVSGGEQCKYLACLDQRIGNYSDGRVQMVGQ